MEEAGAQVAPPIFIQQTLGTGFRDGLSMTKKRSLPFRPPIFQHQYQQQPRFSAGSNWNPNEWDWDSVRFIAKPLELDISCIGAERPVQSMQRRTSDDGEGSEFPTNENSVDKDDESLRLNLGGSLNSFEEPMSKANKRVRSGSPGGCGSYPMCQVDNCREDLSNAKDYHRRHKVCEFHSKSSQALVGKQMQRFCQQCSRFHPLSEFDEGKRSCRRRLAGHNRRRRKTQTEDVSSRTLLSGNTDNTGNGVLDIVNLLTVLARAQDLEAKKIPMSEKLNKTVPEQASSYNQRGLNGNIASSSTRDFLTVLSATLAAPSPNPIAILSQRSCQNVDADKSMDQPLSLSMQNGEGLEFPSVGGERSSSSYPSPIEDSNSLVHVAPAMLPLQLFSSSTEDDSPPNLGCARKYFSSDSSNPIEETSPSSSPPVVQKLFSVQTMRATEPQRISKCGQNGNVETIRARDCVTSLDCFGHSNRGLDHSSFESYPCQAGYTSSSGSDHSPSSSNSEAQDRTGRMVFKLFGQNPGQLPETLRTQIYNWLSHSPSEMESYIRPGCIVLSIYISMPSSAWEQLESNLLQHVSSLVWDSDGGFWRNGRFLVQIGRQLASHKDGEIRLCKTWRARHFPKLVSVSPLAVVGGEETSLVLRGRNLNSPGTKIYCTHMGGYLSKEVLGSATQETVHDEMSSTSFKIHGLVPGVLSRCFIEVENGFKGTSFPVIIADAAICQELRLLEFEFDEGANVHDTIPEDQIYDFGRPSSEMEALHFLNELGWLFQRKRKSSLIDNTGYTLARFQFLFTFSVERDCCALVKTLLDILLERDLHRGEPSRESLEMLSEIHLLNRALKRRCKNMVDLLIHYSVFSGNAAKYIFPPNHLGPGGITPLHLAACTSGSDDFVDALTSDPQEIGLHCWNSLLDANGLSPHAYAAMRNHHSYNRLVARKLSDRKNGEVSIFVGNEIDRLTLGVSQDEHHGSQFKRGQKSCSKCAVLASRYNRRRMPGSRGFLHRPYINSMLAIAVVCVCVCVLLRGRPDVGLCAPFMWENLDYGTS